MKVEEATLVPKPRVVFGPAGPRLKGAAALILAEVGVLMYARLPLSC